MNQEIFYSGTREWEAEEQKRLNPVCDNCRFKLSMHHCMHATPNTRHDCHKKDQLKRHACPNPDNPWSIKVVSEGGGDNRGKIKALPKPTGQFGWFTGTLYTPSAGIMPEGCFKCGEKVGVEWWGGYRFCSKCKPNYNKVASQPSKEVKNNMVRWFFLLSGGVVFYLFLGFWGDSQRIAFHIFNYGVQWRVFATILFVAFSSLKLKGR